ncbi:hypothetical protein SOM08_15245 [Hydrogenophaga sp. SNF1]|uniref:hypothetical protein n=1 Tax=Hydrogenophaga sp. SNF1 TaxID=3098762 RepID=UPI002ACC1894|nr:hypothetical protein [Hydrogenophaga sp. SNF1]WQB82350.1 hypothetical protein SOM08_15245 [Hydrogenophaga sp. SNF1]
MSTTKHLDTAIAILGGGKTRKSRKNEIVLTDLGDQGVAVQVNGRQVHVAADMESARADAARREAVMMKKRSAKQVQQDTKIKLYDSEEAVMDAAVNSQRARPVVAQTPDGRYALCCRSTARRMGWTLLCRLWGVGHG